MKLGMVFLFWGVAAAQEGAHQHPAAPPPVALQPLAQQVRQLEEALNYLGQPLPAASRKRINDAIGDADQAAAVAQIEAALDPYVLATVDINPESRVKVEQGAARPELVEAGTRLFLVKVINNGHVTAPLAVESPNSGAVYIRSTGNPEPPIQLTPRESAERWADISLYQRPPMGRRLSGLALEYAVLEVYSRDAGQRSAKVSFNVGQGSQDIGFRNDVTILFTAQPARLITLRVKDENGKPAMASFVIRDRLNRLYPNPAKRLAPDFFFQPQIYRADGETVRLPAGYYTVQVERRPGVPAAHARVRSERRGPRRSLLPAPTLDRPLEIRMVFRRPSCARRRLLALHESDRGRGTRRHDAADSGRGPEYRIGAHLGARLLLPEAVLFGQRRPALETR